MLTVFLLVVSLLLFVLFVWGSIFNAWAFWMIHVRRHRHESFLPLLPGLAGAVALEAFPLYPVAHLRWLPLLLDIGCLPLFVGVCGIEARVRWTAKRNGGDS